MKINNICKNMSLIIFTHNNKTIYISIKLLLTKHFVENALRDVTRPISPLATGCLYFKVLFQTIIRKDNKIAERRLGMSIEVWRTNRLYNCIWHLIVCSTNHPPDSRTTSPPLLTMTNYFNFMWNAYRWYCI